KRPVRMRVLRARGFIGAPTFGVSKALCGETPGSYRIRRRAHACEARFLQGYAHDRRPIKLSGRFSSPMFHVKHRGFLFVPWCDLCAVFVDGCWFLCEATMIRGCCGISASWLFPCWSVF